PVGLHLKTQLGDGAAVDLDAPLADQFFAGSSGCDAAAGHVLVQPLRGQRQPTSTEAAGSAMGAGAFGDRGPAPGPGHALQPGGGGRRLAAPRSEEHTSELQSRENLVCRLLPEKKKPEPQPQELGTAEHTPT